MSIQNSTLRGLAPIRKVRPRSAAVTLAGSVTVTIAQLRGFLLTASPGAPVTWTLPTASQLVSELPLEVSNALEFVVRNLGTADITLSVPAGSGTLVGNAVTSINEYQRYFLRIDVAGGTSPSYTVQSVGVASGPSSNLAQVWERIQDPGTGVLVIRENTGAPGITFAEDLVFGSPSSADTGDPAHDTRMVFIKASAAFRAGTAQGSQWDPANVGEASAACGLNNTASGDFSAVRGGENNVAAGSLDVVGGGRNNVTLAGGQLRFIGGGSDNTIASVGTGHCIVGGESNTIAAGAGTHDIILGGLNNTISEGSFSFLGGGEENLIRGSFCVLGGGLQNSALSTGAVVGGGTLNVARGQWATVLGGTTNTASGTEAVVLGGSGNTASGAQSCVPGGLDNTAAGAQSLVCGRNASDDGFANCFVFGDGVGNTVPVAPRQIVWNVDGGMFIDTGAMGAVLQTVINTGSTVPPGTQFPTWNYTVDADADWDDPNPTNMADAIDRLAAAVAAQSMAPVP